MRYTRQSLLRMAHEMDKDWGIFDLIYFWQECGCENMYKLFGQMSKRDLLWLMNQCYLESEGRRYNDAIVNKMHVNAYIVLSEKLERK